MAKVIYRGKADIRSLGKADLAKKGVEDFSATKFMRGEATEVSAEVAKVLTNKENEKFFGKFEAEESSSKEAEKEVATDKNTTNQKVTSK